MALGRLNRPGLMVYGGTIRPGKCGEDGPPLDIVSAFQAYGKYLQDGATPEAEKERVSGISFESWVLFSERGECGRADSLASSFFVLRLLSLGTLALELELAEE